MSTWALTAIVVITLCHIVGGITAFGSSLMSMAILLLLGGNDCTNECVGVLAWCGLLQALMILITSWRDVRWREVMLVLIFAGTFLSIGRRFASVAVPATVSLVPGCLLTVAGLSLLSQRFHHLKIPVGLRLIILSIVGSVHGGFASGGILLVPYMRMTHPQRDSFRASLSAIWVGLNILLVPCNCHNFG